MTTSDARPMLLFFDGDCPLCRREGAMLERLDRGRGRLKLVDIAAPEFDAAAYGLPSDAPVMDQMHGLTPEGEVLVGMAVFRRAYRDISRGWGWLLAPTGWPGLKWVFDWLYELFARNRMRLTGRGCEKGVCGPRRMSADSDQSR